MAEIQVSIVLPYALRLIDGEYQTARTGETITITAPLEEENHPQRIVSAVFQQNEVLDSDHRQSLRAQYGDRLLRRSNRLLRWYRAARQRADISELTRAQASPFIFKVINGEAEGWDRPLRYEETGPIPLDLTVDQLTAEVRAGLAGGNDPDVDVLFLLDAERAVQQGRFREAVLFCWSTIDSVFNRKYESLVDATLSAEFGGARAHLKGLDFGLKNKMSVGLKLVANRSLFNEPGPFWDRMSDSYSKRNAIIHRGENASEDEARQALSVARQIVQIMSEV